MTEVSTVTGVIDSRDLGVCLTHEHIVNDVTSWWHQGEGETGARLADARVSMDILWELRQDPFACRDNCRLDDLELAVAEVGRFAGLGGRTILEATSASIGRDPARLREVAERTGVQIVMGTGLYLDSSQPDGIDSVGMDDLVAAMEADLAEGVDGVRAGFIGEIGVGSDFTPRERRSLAAASIAQSRTRVPMQVHLPGWFRLGHEVADVVEGHGGDLSATVLCHMNPSGSDVDYQVSLLERGLWLQYDMVGMEVFYADQGAQCPSDEENAANIARLVQLGWGHRVLVSSDIFIKSLLRAYGGPGYGHVLEYFLPRLVRHGLTPEQARSLVTDNPAALFTTAKGDPA